AIGVRAAAAEDSRAARCRIGELDQSSADRRRRVGTLVQHRRSSEAEAGRLANSDLSRRLSGLLPNDAHSDPARPRRRGIGSGPSPRAVVINQYMASTYWPGADPIGQRLSISGFVGYTIVGVVKNDVRDDWAGPPAAEMFMPYEQESSYRTTNGGAKSYLTLVVRAKCADGAACNAAAVALAPPVVATIRAVD